MNIKNARTKQDKFNISSKLKAIASTNIDCQNIKAVSQQVGTGFSDYGYKNVQALKGAMRDIVPMLAIGQISQPVRAGEYVKFFMTCDKEELSFNEQYKLKQDIAGKILSSKKLNEAAEDYLKDLKRSSTIEILQN